VARHGRGRRGRGNDEIAAGLRGTLERAWARWDHVAWGRAGMAFPVLVM
jgi:hypothetical protein